jgi:two-component system, NtrC family, sensor kinase
MASEPQPVEKKNYPSIGAYLLPYPLDTLSHPIPLASDRVTIGRSPKSVIVINMNTVSRHHAVIVSHDGHYYIKDNDSRNGTFVNAERISTSRIVHHDRIAFGDRHFVFLVTGKGRDALLDATGSLTLSREELEPSDFLAYEAELARMELFPARDTAPSPLLSDSAAKKPTLLERLSGRRTDAPLSTATDRQSRLIADMHRDHQRLSLLYRLSERIRAAAEPMAIVGEGLDLIMEALPTAARALVMLRSGPGGALKIIASRDRNPEISGAAMCISRTLLEWVLTEKMALMTPDVSEDSRLKDSESIKMSHLNAIICVPMLISQRVVGVIYVDSEDLLEPITQADVAFIAAVGHELAMSIANAQLQKSLIRSERMAAIGLTVSNLAHNIKNLVMMNQNALELMRLHLDRIGDEKADQCWHIIEKGFARTSTLAMEMLEYVREERLDSVMTDINALIRSNTDIFEQHLAAKGSQLTLALDSAEPRWVIDPKQFQRALLNIVTNAVDAIGDKPNGKVRIATCLDDGGRLVVSVIDNGCGIPADKRKRIFDLFFTTKGTGGSGLGLPMVSKFVTASGGRLAVSSKPGLGTRFQMIFQPGQHPAEQSSPSP